jgi:general secretion pathway protein E
MVGEIRDLETAEIAIQASLTGHLVLSTLHTNDSASAVTRLLDMGIEPYLISSSVIAVMAQRLLRLICPSCKSACQAQEQASSGGTAILAVNHGLEARATALRAGLSESERALVSQGQFYKGLGCDNCLKTGYFGRTGIFELLVVDDEIRELIIKRRGSHIIKEAATGKGMSALRADGLRKALAGQTTLDEVCRVTQDVETNIGAAKRVSA